jgi:hypothetical protein
VAGTDQPIALPVAYTASRLDAGSTLGNRLAPLDLAPQAASRGLAFASLPQAAQVTPQISAFTPDGINALIQRVSRLTCWRAATCSGLCCRSSSAFAAVRTAGAMRDGLRLL